MRKLSFTIYLFFCTWGFCQEVSTKAEIAVFNAFQDNAPKSFSESSCHILSEKVKQLKRFEVLTFAESLPTYDLKHFIKEISHYKETHTVLPESVLSGRAALTKEDWEKLSRSYYILVCQVENFQGKKSLHIIDDNADNLNSFFNFFNTTQNYDIKHKKNLLEIFGKTYDLTPAEFYKAYVYGFINFNEQKFCKNEFSFFDLKTAFKNNLKVEFLYSISAIISVTVLDIKNQRVETVINLPISASSNSASKTLTSIFDKLDFSLSKELASVPAFKLKTGIMEVSKNGKKVKLELGKNYGIKVGHEFSAVDFNVVGKCTTQKETALLVITDVQENSSNAQVLYANKKLFLGEQLYEIPRLPFELTFYGNMLVNFSSVKSKITGGSIGFKTTFTEGMLRFRPILGAEIQIGTKIPETPVNIKTFLGCEMFNVFAGRFQFSPETRISVSMYMDPSKKKYEFYGISGEARLNFYGLVSRDMKMGTALGISLNFTPTTKSVKLDGIFEAGITFKM